MTLGRWRILATASVVMTLLGASRSSAQGTIVGRVTQDGGQPLADVRVLAIGTSLSAVTNDSGRFTLKNVPAGTVQLQVLRVGFQSQRNAVAVTSGQTATADFVLKIAVAQLDEVVTTATGQQRRVELGNAISTLGDVSSRVETSEVHTIGDLGSKGTGRSGFAAHDDRRRADGPHPRTFIDQLVERADLDRRRRSIRVGQRQPQFPNVVLDAQLVEPRGN